MQLEVSRATKVMSHVTGVRKKADSQKEVREAADSQKKGCARQKVWEPLVQPTAQRSFLSWRYSTH